MENKTNEKAGVILPDVTVKLSGTDGNVFAIMGAVSRAMKAKGHYDEAAEFQKKAFNSPSYNAVLALCTKYVNVK